MPKAKLKESTKYFIIRANAGVLDIVSYTCFDSIEAARKELEFKWDTNNLPGYIYIVKAVAKVCKPATLKLETLP